MDVVIDFEDEYFFDWFYQKASPGDPNCKLCEVLRCVSCWLLLCGTMCEYAARGAWELVYCICVFFCASVDQPIRLPVATGNNNASCCALCLAHV